MEDTTPTTTEALQGTTGPQKGIGETGGDVAQLNGIEQLDKTGVETLLALLTTKTQTECAERLQIERSTLWYRVKKYKLDEIVSQIPRQALMRLQLASTSAAEKLVEKLDNRSESLEAATQILDRVGLSGKPTTMIQNNVTGDMKLEFSE